MTTTIIVTIIISVLAELIRMNFLLKKTGLRFRKKYAVSSAILIAAIVLPTIWSAAANNETQLFLSLTALAVGICVENLIFLFSNANFTEKISLKSMLATYLPAVIITVSFSLLLQNKIDKEFEKQWLETSEMVISETPIRTVVSGHEKLIIETNAEDDIVITISNENLNVLKLQKGDKIKYRKDRNKERLQILTLRKQNYSE